MTDEERASEIQDGSVCCSSGIGTYEAVLRLIAEVRAEEREACAKIIDDLATTLDAQSPGHNAVVRGIAKASCGLIREGATAIRRRSLRALGVEIPE